MTLSTIIVVLIVVAAVFLGVILNTALTNWPGAVSAIVLAAVAAISIDLLRRWNWTPMCRLLQAALATGHTCSLVIAVFGGMILGFAASHTLRRWRDGLDVDTGPDLRDARNLLNSRK